MHARRILAGLSWVLAAVAFPGRPSFALEGDQPPAGAITPIGDYDTYQDCFPYGPPYPIGLDPAYLVPYKSCRRAYCSETTNTWWAAPLAWGEAPWGTKECAALTDWNYSDEKELVVYIDWDRNHPFDSCKRIAPNPDDPQYALPETARPGQPLCDGINSDEPRYKPSDFQYTAKYSVVSVIYMPPASRGSYASTVSYDSTAEVGTAITTSTIDSKAQNATASASTLVGGGVSMGTRSDFSNARTDSISVSMYINRPYTSKSDVVLSDIPHLRDIIVLQPHPLIQGTTYPQGGPPLPPGYKKTTWSYSVQRDALGRPQERIEVPVGCLITSVDPTTGRRVYNPQDAEGDICTTEFFRADGKGLLNGLPSVGGLGLTVDDLPDVLRAHPFWNYLYGENGPDSTECGKYWRGNTVNLGDNADHTEESFTIEPIPDRNRFLLLTDSLPAGPLPWRTDTCGGPSGGPSLSLKNSSQFTTTAQSSVTMTSGFEASMNFFGLAAFKLGETASFTYLSSQSGTNISVNGIGVTMGCPLKSPPPPFMNVYVYLDKIYKTFYFSFSAPMGFAAPLLVAPESVYAGAANSSTVTLKWSPVGLPPSGTCGLSSSENSFPFAGANSYVVLYSSAGPGGPYSEVPADSITFDTTTLPATSATVNMSGASAFYYKVAAIGNDGRYHPQSQSAAVTPIGVPAPPAAPTLTRGVGADIVVSIPMPQEGTWGPGAIRSFDVLRANRAESATRIYDWQYLGGSREIPVAVGGPTVYVDKTAAPGSLAAYAVVANNLTGSSNFSPIATITAGGPDSPFPMAWIVPVLFGY